MYFRRLSKLSAAGLIIATIIGPVFSLKAQALTVEEGWVREFGPVDPYFIASAASSDGIYVGGVLQAGVAMPGQTAGGNFDGFIRKYDTSGNEVWTRQLFYNLIDRVEALAADESGVYVFGITEEQLTPEQRKGDDDNFVLKYSTEGELLWVHQLGTTAIDIVWDGAVNANGVYIAGEVKGANYPGFTSADIGNGYVAMLDLEDGSLQWVNQIATDSNYDAAFAVHADDTGMYVGGTTGSDSTQSLGATNYGGGDAFLQKYDTEGNVIWTEQFGTNDYEQVFDIGSYDGGIYVAGETYADMPGETNSGNADVFVARYTTDGTQEWVDEFGSVDYDSAYGITADSTGVYVAGVTAGSLPGFTNLGDQDAFVKKYTADGDSVWLHQYGTSTYDEGHRIVSGENGVVAAGKTMGALPGQTDAGIMNFYLMQLLQDDTDSDGMFDEVDSDVRVLSEAFSDGTTSGSIVTRGDQTLTIEDASDPEEGVVVTAAEGGGATQASVTGCSGATTLYLDAGDSVTLTCGSAIVKTLTGSVEAVFVADNGLVGTVELNSGNEVTFRPELATFTADPENVEPVVVEVVTVTGATGTMTVDPGVVQPMIISVAIDIKPGSAENVINLSGNGVIPVAILTTPTFNAADVDPLSVTLEGAAVRVKGKSGTAGTLQDVDGDGDLDLLVQVENSLQLAPGATTAQLSGKTVSGIPIKGSDLVKVQ